MFTMKAGDEDPALLKAEELVFVLGSALHSAGLPSHRLEDAMARVAGRLGVQVQSLSLPTGLIVSFGRSGPPVTAVIRLAPKPTDLEKLRRLLAEADAIAASGPGTAPDDTIARIKALAESPPRWNRRTTILGFALSAAAFSVFFGGGTREFAVAAIVGTVVGVIAYLFGTKRGANRRFELAAATSAGLIAGASDSNWIPLASGMVVLLPGLALVDAIEELANGHLASGAARMAGVGVTFLSLVFGVLLGVALDDVILGDATIISTTRLPWWTVLPALATVAAGSVFRFQGRVGDWGLFLVASALAYGGSKLGVLLGNPLLGPFVGASLLALAANLFAQRKGSPAQLVLVPGLALLVPGSFGFRSMNLLLSGNAVTGIEQGFQMFMMAMSIVAGLLAGTSLAESEWLRLLRQKVTDPFGKHRGTGNAESTR